MGIEAGSSTYYQAKRGIPRDNLVFYIDPSVKDSYRNIGDNKIYSLVNPSHYMDINAGSNYRRGRKNCGIEYTGGNSYGTMSVSSLAGTYGMSLVDSTYILYAKCTKDFDGLGGAFDNWILQLGSYYGNCSWGVGIHANSFMVYHKGSGTSGWTYGASSTSGKTYYLNRLGEWVFYVVRFNGNDAFEVYMDNVRYWNAGNLPQVNTTIASNYMYLGRNQEQTVGLFAVYDTALSDNEISDFYNATRHRFGL